MRINFCAQNNVNFGHIYSRAIDTVRSNNDNYFKTFKYDAFDDYCEFPGLVEGYYTTKGQNDIKLMSDKDVSVLGKLVDRASKLKKSIIAQYGKSAIAMVVSEDGKRVIKSEHELRKGNTGYNLNQLEELVEEAEEHENNPNASDISPFVAEGKYLAVNRVKSEPRYQEMYDKAICNDRIRKI